MSPVEQSNVLVLTNPMALRVFKSCLTMRGDRQGLVFNGYYFDIEKVSTGSKDWFLFTKYAVEQQNYQTSELMKWASCSDPDEFQFPSSESYSKISVPRTDRSNALNELFNFVNAIISIDSYFDRHAILFFNINDPIVHQRLRIAKRHLAHLFGWLKYKNVLLGKLKLENM